MVSGAILPQLTKLRNVAAKSLIKIGARQRQASLEVAASAVAAGLAWFLARRLLGHPEPLFAAIVLAALAV